MQLQMHLIAISLQHKLQCWNDSMDENRLLINSNPLLLLGVHMYLLLDHTMRTKLLPAIHIGSGNLKQTQTREFIDSIWPITSMNNSDTRSVKFKTLHTGWVHRNAFCQTPRGNWSSFPKMRVICRPTTYLPNWTEPICNRNIDYSSNWPACLSSGR